MYCVSWAILVFVWMFLLLVFCLCMASLIVAEGGYHRPWRADNNNPPSNYHDYNHASYVPFEEVEEESSSASSHYRRIKEEKCKKQALNLTIQFQTNMTSCPIKFPPLPSYINPKAWITTFDFTCANGNNQTCCYQNQTISSWINATYVQACTNLTQLFFINQIPFNAKRLRNGTYVVAAVLLGPADQPLNLKQITWFWKGPAKNCTNNGWPIIRHSEWSDPAKNCTLSLNYMQSRDSKCLLTTDPIPACSACPPPPP